jgi:hypothetical protein
VTSDGRKNRRPESEVVTSNVRKDRRQESGGRSQEAGVNERCMLAFF